MNDVVLCCGFVVVWNENAFLRAKVATWGKRAHSSFRNDRVRTDYVK